MDGWINKGWVVFTDRGMSSSVALTWYWWELNLEMKVKIFHDFYETCKTSDVYLRLQKLSCLWLYWYCSEKLIFWFHETNIVTTETFHIFAPYFDEKDFIILYILVNHCSDSPGGVFFFIGELLKPSKVLIFMTTDRKLDYDSTKNLLTFLFFFTLDLTWSYWVNEEEAQQKPESPSWWERVLQYETTSLTIRSQSGGRVVLTLFLYCCCVQMVTVSPAFIKHQLSSCEG